jgi:hypothetical protein
MFYPGKTEMPLFEMENTHTILTMDLEPGKAFLKAKIERNKEFHKPKSIEKAYKMIERANDTRSLAIGVSNFILAFQSRSLKAWKRTKYDKSKHKF